MVCYKINKPSIVGDGIHNISYLIKEFLKTGKGSNLDVSQIDYNLINDQGYDQGYDSILPKDKIIYISNAANGTIGSTQEIIPIKKIHPANIKLFKKN